MWWRITSPPGLSAEGPSGVRFFRERLSALGAMRNAALRSEDLRQDMRVTVAGLVLVRQRPGIAKGVIFMTLEDETDIANIIVWPKAFEHNRCVVMNGRRWRCAAVCNAQG